MKYPKHFMWFDLEPVHQMLFESLNQQIFLYPTKRGTGARTDRANDLCLSAELVNLTGAVQVGR